MVKIGSLTAVLFLIWTNVARTNVAWVNVIMTIGICSIWSQEPTFKVWSKYEKCWSLCSVLFCSVLFCSVLFCSVLECFLHRANVALYKIGLLRNWALLEKIGRRLKKQLFEYQGNRNIDSGEKLMFLIENDNDRFIYFCDNLHSGQYFEWLCNNILSRKWKFDILQETLCKMLALMNIRIYLWKFNHFNRFNQIVYFSSIILIQSWIPCSNHE